MNAFALIFADNYVRSNLGVLDNRRLISSLPVGGRFRLIDFSLSALVNGRVSNIGIIARRTYNSLMDHVGWGKDWDLNRKNGGLKILTPLAVESDLQSYRTRFEALCNVQNYINEMLQEYCILMEGSMVFTIDIQELMNFHMRKGADITVVYKKRVPREEETEVIVDENGKIIDALYHSEEGTKEENCLLNIYIMKRNFLKKMVNKGLTLGWEDISRDYICKNFTERTIYAYELKNYCRKVHSMKDYYETNMDLRENEIRRKLFLSNYPILTRTKDSAPTYYGMESKAVNSILADGCVVDGCVENSIIFRNVSIAKGAVIRNSIIMQDTKIEQNARLDYVISDKRVTVSEGIELKGSGNCPVVIPKAETV